MMYTSTTSCIAFFGQCRIAQGLLSEVAMVVKARLDQHPQCSILVFDAQSSVQLDLNLQGTPEQVMARYSTYGVLGSENSPVDTESSTNARRTPGRPKLGVTPREVTLLPRHWEWLSSQPGGASVALRKLVEHEMRAAGSKDQSRQWSEATYRFIQAMAGNEPGFEEATRALFANNENGFHLSIKDWPADIQKHAKQLANPIFNMTQE